MKVNNNSKQNDDLDFFVYEQNEIIDEIGIESYKNEIFIQEKASEGKYIYECIEPEEIKEVHSDMFWKICDKIDELNPELKCEEIKRRAGIIEKKLGKKIKVKQILKQIFKGEK